MGQSQSEANINRIATVWQIQNSLNLDRSKWIGKIKLKNYAPLRLMTTTIEFYGKPLNAPFSVDRTHITPPYQAQKVGIALPPY